ncbi:cysteine protease LapG [Halopseudomonas yangmingensis]|uniref:Predicted transglutaminase-like cysteine proteinase n=1 Tax=Halopseudomonas yangmingensis TaxID=1720063 RepID=A0A1I4S524_9GAMM|nr:transglutaminase-like cysteine peptidase [Halopseudomonas yangmingensis]SFM59608.1 Predicted transglutaminase-like cysteine proteinase [Halopseudomonas yangmingensis]
MTANPARIWSCLLLLAALLLSLGSGAWNFERIIERAQQRYGMDLQAHWRLQEWERLLQQSTTLSLHEQLQAVNLFFNQRLRFADDIDIWGQNDYWATPVEALIKGAADCEDYAIAKYFSLRRLGISNDQLRLTYVKAIELNQAHMVLTFYPTADSEPLVLDNLIDRILPASQRSDLLPVYSFNAEGLWLDGQGRSSRTGSPTQLSRWQDLLLKMRDEGFPAPGAH